MKALFASAALMLGLMTTGVYAADVAAPATAPTGSTGLCNDGSYYNGTAKKGACRGHKGVKDWYGTGTAAAAVTTTAAPVALPKKTTVTTTTSVAATGPAPAGATGLCNDGTYYTGANKKGACRGHKGVKDWYAATGATTATTSTTAPAPAAAAPAPEKKGFSLFGKKPAQPAATPAPAPAAVPAPATAVPAPATVAAKAAPAAAVTAGAVAAGGGAGQVWVNTDSNVYHCQGSHWYGKTKQGQYMTEAAAKAAGARPDHNKACS